MPEKENKKENKRSALLSVWSEEGGTVPDAPGDGEKALKENAIHLQGTGFP